VKITAKNYEKQQKRFVELKNQIQAIPDVFKSTSFAIKNKLIKFNELNNALKEFDKKSGCPHNNRSITN
jgi:hypothetical protein